MAEEAKSKQGWGFGEAMTVGGTLIDFWGISQQVQSEVDRLLTSARAESEDAAALEESLTDQINEMERVIYRNIGSATAAIGASGVSMRGSPMDALIQMHGIAQQDIKAAHRRRNVEVNRAYLNAINKTRQATAVARRGEYEIFSTAVEAGAKLFGSFG